MVTPGVYCTVDRSSYTQISSLLSVHREYVHGFTYDVFLFGSVVWTPATPLSGVPTEPSLAEAHHDTGIQSRHRQRRTPEPLRALLSRSKQISLTHSLLAVYKCSEALIIRQYTYVCIYTYACTYVRIYSETLII